MPEIGNEPAEPIDVAPPCCYCDNYGTEERPLRLVEGFRLACDDCIAKFKPEIIDPASRREKPTAA
jgi:hypothetical protein